MNAQFFTEGLTDKCMLVNVGKCFWRDYTKAAGSDEQGCCGRERSLPFALEKRRLSSAVVLCNGRENIARIGKV